MLLELLLERLKAALRVKGNWAVYAAYDPAPFAKREESFLTVGITALETEQAVSDETYWYFPFSAAAQVRLLTAPETDAQVLYNRYWQTVVSGMLSAGCTVQKIRTGAPTEWKQFRMPDWPQLLTLMRDNILVDSRNIFDKEEVLNAGLRYYGIGK